MLCNIVLKAVLPESTAVKNGLKIVKTFHFTVILTVVEYAQ